MSSMASRMWGFLVGDRVENVLRLFIVVAMIFVAAMLVIPLLGCGWGNPTTSIDLWRGKYTSDKDFALYAKGAEYDPASGRFKIDECEITNTGSSVLAEKKYLWEMQTQSYMASMQLLQQMIPLARLGGSLGGSLDGAGGLGGVSGLLGGGRGATGLHIGDATNLQVQQNSLSQGGVTNPPPDVPAVSQGAGIAGTPDGGSSAAR